MNKEEIKDMCQMTLLAVETLINTIKECGLQDEQFVLDYCDKLNELSIKF